MSAIDNTTAAHVPSTTPNLTPAGASGRGHVVTWSLVAIICALLAGGAGYVAGHSGGADLHKARIDGARSGTVRGHAAGSSRGYSAGFAAGRKQGFAKAYKPAYAKAYRQASKGARP